MPKVQITQPKLRDPSEHERVVRVAGFKFILPCNWKPGDVLDEDSAAFINAAWHTAAINGFSERRRDLMNDPRTTYQVLDEELQAHYEVYKRQTRTLDASDARPGKTDAEKKLISYARPRFNAAVRDKKLPRKDYEALLVKYVEKNRAKLEADMKREHKVMKDIMAQMSDLSN